jgi:hypothetical protein
MGVGQRHAPAALPLRKTRYPLSRRLGGPHGWSGRVGKNSHRKQRIKYAINIGVNFVGYICNTGEICLCFTLNPLSILYFFELPKGGQAGRTVLQKY